MNAKIVQLAGTVPVLRAAVVLAAVGLVAIFPALAGEAALFAIRNLVLIGPVILIGIGLTSAIMASGSITLIRAAFEGQVVRMIGVAAFVGALTPVCGVSVLPLVAGLLAARVPLAPIMAFWLSSPITDPGMLAVTGATLGWPFALAKTASAFGIGLFGGFSTLLLTRLGCFHDPVRSSGILARVSERACGQAGDDELKWRFWTDSGRVAVFRDTALETGRLMILWLCVAFVAEFFMKRYLPDEFVIALVGHDRSWAVPLAAIVGAPIYLDGYAALPLVRGLIDAGMRPDAALAFLVAGGITSAWAAIPVFALVRLPVFGFYIALAVAGSVFAGWASRVILV
ncbi:MAG TPA: permease [Afifellaceae bacterium]|nr:permease [Afifellaceae bacterium]